MEILLRENSKQIIFRIQGGLVFSDGKTPGLLLAPDCTGLFDIAFKDTIHGIYVSENGEIIHLEKLGEGWRKSVVLKSKNGKMAIFGPRLIFSEQNLNLIYGLYHNLEKLIVHQVLPDGTPNVITSSHSDRFFVRRDDCGCVYVITEAAENIWHFSHLRNGVWSSPEELISDCSLKDIMTDGYKNFCMLYESKDGKFVSCGSTEFSVNGDNPYLVKDNGTFRAVSQKNGRVYCTDSGGEKLLITSDTVRDYILRLPESGEYAVCEHCSGNLIHNNPRLFLIDRATPSAKNTGDSVKLELTKRIISLETRIAALENTIRMYNPPKEQTTPQESQ